MQFFGRAESIEANIVEYISAINRVLALTCLMKVQSSLDLPNKRVGPNKVEVNIFPLTFKVIGRS